MSRNAHVTRCYHQACQTPATTREHIPPKSFFPSDQRKQLLTVRSCRAHNTAKSTDDIYVLAQICMNTSPANRSHEVFANVVVPQLSHNNHALRRTLLAGSSAHASGRVSYQVDTGRLDRFFTALSCGIVFKASGAALPSDYITMHIYHDLVRPNEPPELAALREEIKRFYHTDVVPMRILDFGSVPLLNATVYSASVFGVPGFLSSITVTHTFFGRFRVTSMLTMPVDPALLDALDADDEEDVSPADPSGPSGV